MAGVLSHEIGHITGNHHGRRQTAHVTNKVLSTTAYILTGSGDIADASNMYGAELVSGYGRDMELEADGSGAEFMYKSGYEPDALLAVIGVLKDQEQFQRVKAKSGGKKIGSYSLRATGTTWIRIALAKKYKVNVSYKGGDFSWVQIPAPALLSALETGRVAAATLIHAQAYSALKTGNYRVLAWTNKDIKELYGIDSLSAINVTYPEKLKARPEAFKEFNRMMYESVKYAVAHADEVGAAIAKKLSGPNVEMVIHYNNSKSDAEKLRKKLSQMGSKIYLVKGDLSKETDLNKIIKFAKSKLKYFDCLINNASLFENDKSKILHLIVGGVI